jgi:DNA-binding LacI/PurR family transcriptional regulator
MVDAFRTAQPLCSAPTGPYGRPNAISRNISRKSTKNALFAGNDTIALGAISALREAGLSVPSDVAIVGFDDLPFAAYSSPKLTTVPTQAVAQGEQAALAAIELLGGQSVGRRNCDLALELIVRESCGAARLNPLLEERRRIA